MKRILLIMVAIALLTSACGQKDAGNKGADAPAPSPSLSTATAESSAPPPKLEALILSSGAVGPLAVGMSKSEALKTGVAVANTAKAVDGCKLQPLVWAPTYQSALDIRTSKKGKITSIGVFSPGPHTMEGLGVGSTLADVTSIYDDAQLVSAGQGQTGLFVHKNEQWLGFLFDEGRKQVKKSSVVIFVEVTSGRKPELIRDGC